MREDGTDDGSDAAREYSGIREALKFTGAMMTDGLSDLLKHYDELADVVANSTSHFYQENLARLFSLIDAIPEFSSTAHKLEALSDFDAWYNELENRRKSHGMVLPGFNLPSNPDGAVGI
jgi:hypothetical protein